jgi:iron-sulfur cluster protein
MSSQSREEKAAAIRAVLEAEGESVGENTRGFNQGRYESTARLPDYQALRDEARAIKEDAIDRLPELVEELRDTVEANGGTVYVADDAADANQYIEEVCAAADADSVIKSKSMTSEEIEVNERLDDAGMDVVETDLGEWVLQIADEAPSHIVAPAVHKSRAEIADLFNAHFDPAEPLETAEELTMFARERLLDHIKTADVGMTGANFLTADAGTMALVTSEGNARKTVAVPDTHVAVAGVEKIIPSVEDLRPFIELIGRSGTGQDITSYISLFTPPVDSPAVDFDAPETPITDGAIDRAFHLVLIDNGRLEMREDDDLRETLYCIRCSACSNSCANFQAVGGHAFGGETYSGGIATGWEAGVEDLETAGEFNDFCTGCSRCVPACPVEIDIPWINTVVRDRVNRGQEGDLDWLVEGLTPDAESGGMDPQKRLFGNFATLARLGSATAPVSNWLADAGPTRWLMERWLGIDRRRDLPAFQRETFRTWAQGRQTVQDAEREVVVYPDLYTNHVQVERGKATVRALEALGVAVRVPDAPASGRAPLSQGMIATARDHATAVADALLPQVEAGRDVVVIEPSDYALFQREYERLLDADKYEALAASSYEVFEYVADLVADDGDAADLADLTAGDGHTIAYHSHCQQRTLGVESYTEAVLEDLGYDVATSEVECCGMAGSFGYKQEYYDVSMAVGEELADQFRREETGDRTVVASGTSCLEQLDDLLARPARHPIELVAPTEADGD